MADSFFTKWERVIKRMPRECRYPNCRCGMTCKRDGRFVDGIAADRRAAYIQSHETPCPHGVRGWIYCSNCNSD